MMDWYYGHEAGDLVVPKEQEYFDRLPSPDSWSQWGTCGSGYSGGWPNNFDAGKISNLSDGKSHQQQQMLFGKSNKEINLVEEELDHSYGSSNVAGSSEDSILSRNADACGRADFYFSNLTGTDANAMDDIFLNSLIQDDVPVAVQNQGLFSFSAQCRNSVTSSDSDFVNKMMDCHSVPCGNEGVGNLKCFTSPPFSPSDGSDNGPVSLSNLSYGNYSDQSNGLSPKTRDTLTSEQDGSRRSGNEDSAVEESVLMGLEAVLRQLSNKSRLCLRDSLYRLAHHTKEQMSNESKVEELPLNNFSLLEHVDGPSRSGKTEAAESKTNNIDRAVASLMFNKVDANVQDLLPAMASKFEHIRKNFTGLDDSNYDLNQEDAFLASKYSDMPAHSEVPVFSQQNLLPMQTESRLSQCEMQ